MPDRHQIGHTDREYEYDGAVWLPYFKIFFDDFMRLVTSAYEFYILTILCDVISLLAQVIVSPNRVS